MGLSWQQRPLGRTPTDSFSCRACRSASCTPSHRIDVRRTSRHLVARAGGRVVADTTSPLVLYESGFAPRWYVPRDDVVAEALDPEEQKTFCPYKGVASYYAVDGAGGAAWSYRAPLDDMAAIGDLVSFEPDRVEVRLDGERLELEPGQTRRLARHRPQPHHRRGRRAGGGPGGRGLTGSARPPAATAASRRSPRR